MRFYAREKYFRNNICDLVIIFIKISGKIISYMNCVQQNTQQTGIKSISAEEAIKLKQQWEDQVDYQFIQRIIQELTQSCALPLPVPAAAIPPLILQAAQYFWENFDGAIEERYYCLKNNDFNKCGPNFTVKLPPRIISVFGVYKTTDVFTYGVLGDFSLERMILNNSALASGTGGTLTDVFGSGTGYNLTDVMSGLYEVQTFKTMFDSPLTFNYNAYSNDLVILGALGRSDIILQTFIRCKIQDLYKLYYFFRYCVCLGKKSMSTILGTFEYKMPGGVTINYSRFEDSADNEMEKIDEWCNKQHSADYFFNTNTV